ncbi:MAG: tRNA(Met) cytidine acetyltransferase [Gammaproteobacteria bacterium]|nr:tRNA(Met) cytidine acetyltransferase [Gammaproteobacteria bacterium]
MPANFDQWLNRVLQQLCQINQRQLLSCEGSELWCFQLYEKFFRTREGLLLLSDRDVFSGATACSKVETLLGTECEIVVVDLFGGLNADVICIAAGLVKCGGMLILLSSGQKHWPEVHDQYGIWQNDCPSPAYRFVDYFFESISQNNQACIQIRQNNSLETPPVIPTLMRTDIIDGKTSEQSDALDQISRWLIEGREPIALLTADRGRGKSACLGLAIGNMIENLGFSVIVTAYSRQSAAIVFAHSDSADFVAPDQLIVNDISADVLLVDEAAMLPYTMLVRLFSRFKRILMATTTGGYEGTGQGFLLRFVARLTEDQLLWLKLQQPVRWAQNDCLESWINNTFLLNSQRADSTDESVDLAELQFEEIDRETGTPILRNSYQLMAAAHYRTRPSDLRALMENPDLVALVAKRQNTIMGIVVANCEGGLEGDLCDQVFLGNRRPRGHLLAQMVTAQAGLRNFACSRGLRIQRIAVGEINRRKGIGKQLVERVETCARQHQVDYIGACFALDIGSAGFWLNCGFRLVHVGYGRGKSTGNHTIAVVKIINSDLETGIAQLEHKLRTGLPLMLVQNLRYMIAEDVNALLRFFDYRIDLLQVEKDEITAFTQGHKGFDLCFATLQRYVMQVIASSPAEQYFHCWLVEKVVQNRGWDELTADNDCVGKKSIQKKIRELVGELIP